MISVSFAHLSDTLRSLQQPPGRGPPIDWSLVKLDLQVASGSPAQSDTESFRSFFCLTLSQYCGELHSPLLQPTPPK